jgi:ADP-ribosylglycohydrolase
MRSVPDSVVRERIRHARNLAPEASDRLAVSALGNGVGLSAQDTVPFALWCAARHLNDYEAALWLAVSGLGDRDTICAIVGGIVALYTGQQGIPTKWLQVRESLPSWAV